MKIFSKIKNFFKSNRSLGAAEELAPLPTPKPNQDGNVVYKISPNYLDEPTTKAELVENRVEEVWFNPRTEELVVFTPKGFQYAYEDGFHRVNINDNLYQKWTSDMVRIGNL